MSYYEDLYSARDFANSSLTPKKIEGFSASVEIDSDDDFLLDGEHNFTVYAENYEQLKEKLVNKLNSFKLEEVKSWSITDNEGTRGGDYSHHWYSIRDEAIQLIQEDERWISIGGNQTIDINIKEHKPMLENSQKRKLK